MFLLASRTVCEGDVHAPGGILVGEDAIVMGDVYTDGAVELARGAAIRGQVRPVQAAPARGEGEGAAKVSVPLDAGTFGLRNRPRVAAPSNSPTPRSETELELSALQSTVELLFDLAESHGVQAGDEHTWGLQPDAFSDLMDGILVLVADVFLAELPEQPWPADIVLDLVYGRALASYVPLKVVERSKGHARLRLGRPQFSSKRSSKGWPERAVQVLEHVGRAARPGVSVRPVRDPGADPDAFEVVVDV